MNNQCSCPKPKVFHITEINDDKTVVTLDLCEDCMGRYASQKLVNPSTQSKQPETVTPAEFVKSVFDLLNTFAKAVKATDQTIQSKMPTCPKCGITAKEVQEGGRFGCPDCYEYLAPPKLIQHLQGSAKHVGKVPKRWKEEQEKKKLEKHKEIPTDFRMKGLEIKMDLAAKAEKYELASEIKKALGQLQELSQEIEHLRYALHTAVLDNDEDRIGELKGRISAAEERFFNIEMSVAG